MKDLCVRSSSKTERGTNWLIMSLLFCVVLLLSMLVTVQPVSASEYEEDGFKYTLNGKEATIVGVNKSEKDLVVPEKILDYTVVAIGSDAFSYSDYESITLPNSVKKIGSSVFSGSKNLKKVTLPSELEVLNSSSFASCKALTEVNFGSKLKTIGRNAFYNCINLKSINFPSSLKKIEEGAFKKCIKLTDIGFNKKLEIIGESAFALNYNLKSVTLPASVKKVKERAFNGCVDLNKVVFNNNNIELGEAVFRNCSSLTSIDLPKNLKNIPAKLFKGCKNLKKIKLPTNVTIIKKGAFYNCSKLENIVINSKAYAIGDRAFAYSGIKKLKLNENMQFIGNGAFRDTKLRSIKLGDKVTFIGKGIFKGCENLKVVNVPASVKGINMGAFGGCTSLEAINVAAGNENYSSLSGVLYNKDKSKLLQYPVNKKSTSFVSPSGIEVIRDSAFEGNRHLKSVTINAKTIGMNSFFNMENLKNVKLVNTIHIKPSAFAENKKLTNVILPDSITTIDNLGFCGTNIRTINIPSSLQKLGASVFDNCKNLTEFTGGRTSKFVVQDGVLYTANMKSLIKYPAKKSNSSFTVPDSVVRVKTRAFEYNNNLKELYFGKATKRLNYQSIYKVKRLKSVMFYAKKVSYMLPDSIDDCNNLAVIVGPNNWSLKRMAEFQNATFISA